MPAVADVLARGRRRRRRRVERIVCGAGPGSFTSLRIAASIAKGLAARRGVPLLAVSSLALLAAAAGDARARAGTSPRSMRCAASATSATCDIGRGVAPSQPSARVERWPSAALAARAGRDRAARGCGAGAPRVARRCGTGALESMLARTPPVDLATWEPDYGRLAEAQVKWEAAHGRPLPAA